jgi:hypothetical protein
MIVQHLLSFVVDFCFGCMDDIELVVPGVRQRSGRELVCDYDKRQLVFKQMSCNELQKLQGAASSTCDLCRIGMQNVLW